jgi:hypothetical protein
MAVRVAVRRLDGHRGDLSRYRNLAAAHPLGYMLTRGLHFRAAVLVHASPA